MTTTAEREWRLDCLRWHGRELQGEYRHYCPDWDYLPIDDTCDVEFECCTCPKLSEVAE